MTDRELAFTPAWELSERMAKRELSPVEVTECFLRRIEALDGQLHAFLTVCGDEAMAQAREAEAALSPRRCDRPAPRPARPHKGPERDEGRPHHARLPRLQGRRPRRGRHHRRAGEGRRRHHHRQDQHPGVRAPGHHGEHDRGALPQPLERRPHARRLQRRRGRGRRSGAVPHRHRQRRRGQHSHPRFLLRHLRHQAHPGTGGPPLPHARRLGPVRPERPHVTQCPRLRPVPAGAGRDRILRDPTCLQDAVPSFSDALDGGGVKGLRIGWSADYGYNAVDPEVVASVRTAVAAFTELGAYVEEVVPPIDGDTVFETFRTLFASDNLANVGELLESHADDLTPSLRRMLETARTYGADRIMRALHELEWHRARMDRFFDDYDLLLSPTMAVPAFRIEEFPDVIGGRAVDPMWGYTPFTYPINMTGQTASSVPCGFSKAGLPIGLHVIGPKGAEVRVLRASAAFEAARPWAQHQPPVS